MEALLSMYRAGRTVYRFGDRLLDAMGYDTWQLKSKAYTVGFAGLILLGYFIAAHHNLIAVKPLMDDSYSNSLLNLARILLYALGGKSGTAIAVLSASTQYWSMKMQVMGAAVT